MFRWMYVLGFMGLIWAGPGEARRVGMITVVAGTGQYGYSGDGGPAALATLDSPSGVAVDVEGHLYIADSFNHRVRKVDANTGVITTVVGDGYKDLYNNGRFFRDGWPALEASLWFPTDLEFDPFGNLYILDQFNYRVRRVGAQTGIITTVAGNGSAKWTYSPDWSLATEVDLHSPSHIALGGNGDLLISDEEDNRIRRVDLQTGLIFTLAGDTEPASSGDGRQARQASVGQPGGIGVSPLGAVFVSDGVANTVRRIDTVSGVISTFAGRGDLPLGALGDGGPALYARVSASELAFDPEGHLHIVGGGRVRRVDAHTGIITTVAGGGTHTPGPGAPVRATTVRFSRARDIAFDPEGNLYIAELGGHRVLRVEFVDMPDASPDFDGDGLVGFADFLQMVAAYGSADDTYDLDADGVVGQRDVERLIAVFGRSVEGISE